MEVKINREIREYTESVFFGLSLRQFICSVVACAVAVGLYFLLKEHLPTETVSWICILGAVPFAVVGFFRYNGMTAEKLFLAWVKSQLLTPKHLVFRAENIYYNLFNNEEVSHEQNVKNAFFARQRALFHSKKRAKCHSHQRHL